MNDIDAITKSNKRPSRAAWCCLVAAGVHGNTSWRVENQTTPCNYSEAEAS